MVAAKRVANQPPPKLRASSAIGVDVSGMSDATHILVPNVVSVEGKFPMMAPASDDVIVLRPATSAAAWRRCMATWRRWLRRWPTPVDVQLALGEHSAIELAEALGEAAADAWLSGELDLGGTAS